MTDDQQFKKRLAQSKKTLASRRFNPNDEVQADKIYFTIDNETIGTEGNLVTITGLPKAGKSTFLCALIASSILNDYIFGMRLYLRGDERIGFFDTEQSKYSFKKQVNRICKFAKVKKLTNIDFFLLKEDESHDIVILINDYLQLMKNVKILVIDGLLDLLENMNDEGQSKRIIKTVKQWGHIYGCLIISVLHVGKKDGFSLGHLGSAADRYSQSVLIVEKEKNGTLTLKEKLLRESGGFEPKNITYVKQTNSFEQTNQL